MLTTFVSYTDFTKKRSEWNITEPRSKISSDLEQGEKAQQFQRGRKLLNSRKAKRIGSLTYFSD